MARRFAADNQEMYRAVVTTIVMREGMESRVYHDVLGPYTTLGQARAVITRVKNDAERANAREAARAARYPEELVINPPSVHSCDGRVEQANVTWEEVP